MLVLLSYPAHTGGINRFPAGLRCPAGPLCARLFVAQPAAGPLNPVARRMLGGITRCGLFCDALRHRVNSSERGR